MDGKEMQDFSHQSDGSVAGMAGIAGIATGQEDAGGLNGLKREGERVEQMAADAGMSAGEFLDMLEALPMGLSAYLGLLAPPLLMLVSIVENLQDAGISVPFLLPLVRWVKKSAGASLGPPGEDETEDKSDGK